MAHALAKTRERSDSRLGLGCIERNNFAVEVFAKPVQPAIIAVSNAAPTRMC
jgi:hypothetical protein